VITSGSPGLPGVFESAPQGQPLSNHLDEQLWRLTTNRGLVPHSVTWYYLSPFEQVALVKRPAGLLAIRVPLFEAVNLPKFNGVHRQPEELGSADSFMNSNDKLLDLSALARSTGLILSQFTPVKYNQTCEGQGLSTDKGSSTPCESSEISAFEEQTSCSPACIAGCVPVALAMLASAWKRGNYLGKGNNIFSDAPDWDKPWFNQPASARVSRFIWDGHSLCNTTCDGGTKARDTLFGERLFWTYGLNWNLSYDDDVTWGDVESFLTRNNPTPFLFGGGYKWDSAFNFKANEIKRTSFGLGHHLVCAYGIQGDQQLFVSMGWGGWVADKFIDFRTVQQKFSVSYGGDRLMEDEKESAGSTAK